MGKYPHVLILALGLFCAHKVSATPAPGDSHAGVQTGGVDVVNIYISNVKACAIDWAQEPRFPSVVLSENSVSGSQAGKRVVTREHSAINQVNLHRFGKIYGRSTTGVYVVNPFDDMVGTSCLCAISTVTSENMCRTVSGCSLFIGGDLCLKINYLIINSKQLYEKNHDFRMSGSGLGGDAGLCAMERQHVRPDTDFGNVRVGGGHGGR